MKKVTVKTKKAYDVLIGENLLDEKNLATYFPDANKKAVIIWDEKISPKPVEKIGAALEKNGVECLALSVEGGETAKTLETYARIIDHLTNYKLDKSNLIIAVGGGSVLDLAGFVASTYMRGVRVVNVPTTLLSQVDAAIGGKTALNYNQYKNIIGTINQPELVLVDTTLTDDLSESDFVSEVAEIVKIAFLKDKELVQTLKEKPIVANRKDRAYLVDVISKAIELKAEVVSEDETNENERNILNFGHTFGHAIESESKYRFGHGISVALGMVIITKLAESGKFGKDLVAEGTLDELKAVLKANGLKTDSPFDMKTLTKSVIHDKKIKGDEILLVLPQKVGEGILFTTSIENLR